MENYNNPYNIITDTFYMNDEAPLMSLIDTIDLSLQETKLHSPSWTNIVLAFIWFLIFVGLFVFCILYFRAPE